MWTVAVASAVALSLSPVAEFSLRDGPVPDGSADDLIVPPDSNYGRIFQSSLFDAEFYVEFPVTGPASGPNVGLDLAISATDIDLVYGVSKTFDLSVYSGTGTPTLDAFGLGTALETITLPTNGSFALDVDVTDAWNAAVAAGDDFLGIRIHDPVWTGTLVGAGTIIYGSAALTGVPVPEPGTALLVATALAGLAAAGRRTGVR
jgi:hypothetical protein